LCLRVCQLSVSIFKTRWVGYKFDNRSSNGIKLSIPFEAGMRCVRYPGRCWPRQGEYMRLKFSRSIGVVLGIIAVLVIAPAICAASKDTMSMTPETYGSVSQCFSTSGSMPSHHILLKAVGEQVKPHRFVLSTAESFSWYPITLTIEPSASRTEYVRREIECKIPISTTFENHCRNFLSSEEPPL